MREKRKSRKRHNKRGQILTPVIFLTSLLLFAAGVGIFIYPALSNYLAQREQKEVIEEYAQTVEQIDKDKMARQWELAEEYNETLLGDPVHDPFIPGTGYALPDNYESVLNVNKDGVMGYLKIPKIKVDLPIYHGTSEEVLEKGAGHVDVTALPIGGVNRHPVISAHRGLPSAELFTRLDELEKGDRFFLHILDKTLAYKVDQVRVIKPEELEQLQTYHDKDYVTLLTCTPYGVNTHRLLVRGERIPYEVAEENGGEAFDDEKNQGMPQWVKEYVVMIIAGILLLVFAGRMFRRENKRTAEQKKRRLLFCGIYYFVKTSTPSFVTSTMYSIWDDSPSSIVYTVQPLSSSTKKSGLPSLIIGSIVKIIPGTRSISLPFGVT